MEVLVAFTVLLLVMGATAQVVVASLGVARDSRESVVAANVAQYELERLRSIPFVDWVTSARQSGNNTSTSTDTGVGPDGQVYEVYREATWVAAGSTSSGCETAALGGGSGADYVRVRQVVSFPDRELAPVENVTIITPRLDFYDPFTGNVAVIVRDRDGAPSAGHNVQLSLNGGSIRFERTDAQGCAFFAFLDVDDATSQETYTVGLDTADRVDAETNRRDISRDVIVAAQSTRIVELAYDQPTTYQPIPVYDTAPSAGCVPTLVDAGPQPADDVRDGDPTAAATYPGGARPNLLGLECRDGAGVSQPAGWRVALPHNLTYRVSNPATQFSPTGSRETFGSYGLSALPPSQLCARYDAAGSCGSTEFFPYSSGYTLHAGRCESADPTAFGAADPVLLDATPGQDYAGLGELAVPMRVVTVRSLNPGNQPQANSDVFADQFDATTCPNGDRLYLGRTDVNGQLRVLMPYGRWVLWWDRPNPPTFDGPRLTVTDANLGLIQRVGPLAGPFSCAERPNNCTEIRADVPVDPLVGQLINARRGDRVVN